MAADSTFVQQVPVPPLGPRHFLESGDRISRSEFERRYEAMPELKKAELIEGVVYVGSPVRVEVHGEPHSSANAWLAVYAAATPGIRVADNATVRLDLDNVVQPDVLLRLAPELAPEAGGRARRSEDGYLEGAPELVLEVWASSAAIDHHTKLHVYRRNGVQEYIVWQGLDRRLEWFVLRDDEYAALEPDARGMLHSVVFPGLRLAVSALLDGNLAAVLAEQGAGLDAEEHRRFVAVLGDRLPAR